MLLPPPEIGAVDLGQFRRTSQMTLEVDDAIDRPTDTDHAGVEVVGAFTQETNHQRVVVRDHADELMRGRQRRGLGAEISELAVDLGDAIDVLLPLGLEGLDLAVHDVGIGWAIIDRTGLEGEGTGGEEDDDDEQADADKRTKHRGSWVEGEDTRK